MPRIQINIQISEDNLEVLLTPVLSKILAEQFRKSNLIQPEEKPKAEYIDVQATAEIIRREKSRVYHYTKKGILQAYKIPGIKGLRFLKHEVESVFQQLNFGASITKNSLPNNLTK